MRKKLRFILGLLIFFLALFLSGGLMAQNLVPFGGSRTTDTAYAARSLRIDSLVRFLRYATADTNKVLGVDASGKLTWREKGTAGGLVWSDTVSTIATKSDLLNLAQNDTIFVSQIPGIHQNSNVITGGGTNDRNLIQAVLDLNPKVLIQDGASLIDTVLIIGSNTTFIGLGQHTGFYLDSGARSFMFINRGGYAGNAGIVDSNITISNMYLNGNGMNQIDPVLGGVMANNYGINIINIFGVRNLRMEDITTTKGAQWGIGLFNVKDFFINRHVHLMDWNYYSHYTVGQYVTGQVPLTQDAINFRGGCENGIYTNARISSSDDALAINPIRYSGDPTGLNHDPIKHLLFSNIILENSALGVAVYSDTLVEDIHFENISGTVQWRWGYVGANSSAAGQIIDYNGGKQRNVTFDGVNVRKIAVFPNTFDYQSPYYFVIDGNTEGTLSVTNYNVDSMESYPYIVYQRVGYSEKFDLSLSMVDRNNATSGYPRVALAAAGGQFNVSKFYWYRNATLNQQGKGFVFNDGWKDIFIDGYNVKGIDTFATITGNSSRNITISSGSMDSCATDGGLLEITSSTPTVNVVIPNPSTGSTPVVIGAGASPAIVAGKIKTSAIGIEDWYDPRATSVATNSRGFRIMGSSGAAGVVADNGGYVLALGAWAPDRTTFMSGLHFSGSGSTLTSIRLGTNTTTYGIGITQSTQNVDMPASLSVGNTLTVASTTNIGGITTITNTSNAMFNLQRNINTVGAGNDITFKAKNSSGTDVPYMVISGQIESNTAGSHTGRLVIGPAVAGAIAEKVRISSAGKFSWNGGTATAFVHLPAGTATAGTAPLKLTSGTNMTTPEAGAFEYNGTSLFFTPVSTRLRTVLTDNTLPSAGQIPIGDGTNYNVGSLVAGSGISIVYAGNLTISQNNKESLGGSGGNITLGSNKNYIYNGAGTATWTLPAVTGTAGIVYYLKNGGGNDLTLVTTAAANELFLTSTTNTYTMQVGDGVKIISDGSLYYILPME